jgi:hypothetical protein
MSVVIYAGIQLPYSNSTQFAQRAIYEESNTDRILTEFDISVQCLISSTYAALLNPRLGNVTGNPADFMAWIRQKLLTTKQRLQFLVNGVDLIPNVQTGNPGIVDAYNGPLPQHCELTQLTDTLFVMNYRILAKYWENNNGDLPSVPVTGTNNPGGYILYNRWTESIRIDQNNYTVRTRSGKFAIRSDNVGGFIADQLRSQMAVVGTPENFIRTRNEYKVDPSGLILAYVQEDTEVYKMPPFPAFTADGSITLSATNIGAQWFADVHVHLVGSAITNQISLIRAGFFICTDKVARVCANQPGNPSFIPLSASVTEDLWKNEVTLDMRFRIPKTSLRILAVAGQQGAPNPNDINSYFLASFVGLDNFTPISDPVPPLINPRPNYLVYGTAGLLLRAASYYDPSIVGVLLSSPNVAIENGVVPTQPGALSAQLATTNQGVTTELPEVGTLGAS